MARIFVARSKSYNNSKSLYPTCLIEKKRSSGISSARSRRLHLFLLRCPFAARPGSSQSSRPHDIKNKKREADARRNGRANDEATVRNPDESGSAHASAKAPSGSKVQGKNPLLELPPERSCEIFCRKQVGIRGAHARYGKPPRLPTAT